MTDDGDDKKKANRFLAVDNSILYFQLRAAVVTQNGWKDEKFGMSTDLTTTSKRLKATATIGPEPGQGALLSDAAQEEWRLKVAAFVASLGEKNADILDAISAIWLSRCRSPEEMTVIRAEDILRLRGLSTRGNAFWTEQKRDIAVRIALLSNTWIDVFEAEVYVGRTRKKIQKIRSRAIVVSSVAEETDSDGTTVYAWKIRPGDFFAEMLMGSGKQFAYLDQQLLGLNTATRIPERRIGRYFAWLFRIRGAKAQHLRAVRVGSVLDAIRLDLPDRNLSRFKDRFELALDRLAELGIIRTWQYQSADESTVGNKGWWATWLDWKLLVEPPGQLIEKYSGINYSFLPEPKPVSKSSTADDIVIKMKQARLDRNLTQIKMAEALQIAPNYYAMIERGARSPSRQLRSTITRWLQGK
jgi:DNA-binding XRE family transcriptional regulator